MKTNIYLATLLYEGCDCSREINDDPTNNIGNSMRNRWNDNDGRVEDWSGKGLGINQTTTKE
jgi:hypothetical protein